MSFGDTHDFPVGLVLRVLDIAGVDLLSAAGPADAPSQRAREYAELLALIDEIRAQVEAVVPDGGMSTVDGGPAPGPASAPTHRAA
jgi:hypothetical protein